MQGNSLIESFQGLDLSELTYKRESKKDRGEVMLFDDEKNRLQKTVSQLLSTYYSCCDHEKKVRLQQQISDTIRQQLEAQFVNSSILKDLKDVDLTGNNQFFLWHTWFSDVFNRENGKDGFDIVIGNPPYIQLQGNGGELAKLYEKCGYQTFAKTGDIYCLFYEKGWQLLRSQGHLCFITSNKWMRAGYGEKTRGFFAKQTNPKQLIDFAGVKIFENATVDTNILIYSKDKNEYQTLCAVTDKLNKDNIKELSSFVQDLHIVCCFDSSDSWVILSPIEQSIKQKIESIGIPLKNWNIQINYGIKTGFNDAFIISTDIRKEILANCLTEEERKKTDELIRPILRGRDIKRYGYNWADLWLINTHNGVKGIKPRIDINEYPAVKAHLDKYWDKLMKRVDKGDTPYNLRNCAYIDDFFKPKIVWARLMRISKSEIDSFPRFSKADAGFFVVDSLCFFTGENIDNLCTFLNSSLATYYYLKNIAILDNGGMQMRQQYIEEIPCPKFDYITDDNSIYNLFGFTVDEIGFIENYIKMRKKEILLSTK